MTRSGSAGTPDDRWPWCYTDSAKESTSCSAGPRRIFFFSSVSGAGCLVTVLGASPPKGQRRIRVMMKSERLFGGLVLVLALCLAVPSLAEDLASVDVSSAAVRWEPQGASFEKVVLTVSLPNGNVIRREMKAGQPVV